MTVKVRNNWNRGDLEIRCKTQDVEMGSSFRYDDVMKRCLSLKLAI
jgi:hypothetical protein